MVAVANHTPSATDRLAAFVSGGSTLDLSADELAATAKTWGAWIADQWGRKAHVLDAILLRAGNKYAVAAMRDISAAWQKYNRWLLSQRKRLDEVAQRRAAQKRDRAIATAITGLIIALKYVAPTIS